MTRINCIPVKLLTDSHLLSEYREITRVSSLARPLKDYGVYKMGTGHVKFFYNKGFYLYSRTEELFEECRSRGFNVQYKPYTRHPEGLNEDWEPTQQDIDVNLKRLYEKLRTGNYRFHGEPITYEDYKMMVEIYIEGQGVAV